MNRHVGYSGLINSGLANGSYSDCLRILNAITYITQCEQFLHEDAIVCI